MNLKIVFDDTSLNSLRQSIPAGSRSKRLIESALELKRLENVVVICDAAEVRYLLLYAGHCPSVVASIHKAQRDAGLPIDAD